MLVDLEHIMILLQRRYNAIREIGRLTDELQDAFYRKDEVSASMMLEMRAEEMAKSDACVQEIWAISENGPEEAAAVKRLMSREFRVDSPPKDIEERKIYEIRQRTQSLLDKIQVTDQQMNRRVAGEKSYYVNKQK